MKKLLVLLVAVCLLSANAIARVGETEEELVHRYGEVLSRQKVSTTSQGRTYPFGENLHFRSEDWSIDTWMINERCEQITYKKKGQWSEDQLKHILELNGGRSQWEEQKKPGFTRTWIRRDKATAKLHGGIGFEIRTPVVDQTEAAIEKKAKEEASKLPKF